MKKDEMPPETAEWLRSEGFNPDEYDEYFDIIRSWKEKNNSLLEARTAVEIKEALALVGQMRKRAPSFLYNSTGHFPSSPSKSISDVAGEACEALCTAAMNGDAIAAGQVARLSARLTEVLGSVLESAKTNNDFAAAKSEISKEASLLPYWPILFYSGSKDTLREIYDLFADIGLGSSCPIDLVRLSRSVRGPSLATPLNLVVWTTLAHFYHFRRRDQEFQSYLKTFQHVRRNLGPEKDHPFITHLETLFCTPGARLKYICGRQPPKAEAVILERMLDLDELSPESSDTWAAEAVGPEIERTEDLKAFPSFKNFWAKAGSEREFLSHVRQEIQRALKRLVRPID